MNTTHPFYHLTCAILATTLLLSCQKKQSDTQKSDTHPHEHTEKAVAESGSSEVQSHTPENCPTGKTCFICDPSKRDAGRLWCKEHNRYEDRCWTCHPDLQDKSRMFCSEHGVYEDECNLCHPEISNQKKSKKTSGDSPKSKVLMCNEHGVPEHECAVCHPDLASGLSPGGSLKINLASKNSATKSGISTQQPSEEIVNSSVEAYCVVDYNRDQVTQVTPLVEGVIRKIKVSFGEQVKEGEILAILHSPELAQQKADFLSATAKEKYAKLNLVRQQRPSVKKVSSANRLESAEAEWNIAAADLSAARQKLLNLDLTENDIDELKRSQKPTAELPIRAPFGGTIVRREASVGKLATPGTNLFTLVDPCSMWLELSIPASQVSKIELGMEVVATFNGVPNQTFSGDLIWIDTEINPKTRRAKARALVELPPPSLRKGLFGKAKIKLKPDHSSLTVPAASVQRINEVPFVFIQKSDTLYAATRVRLANATSSDLTKVAILEGVDKNDQIVVAGSYIMRSEFLKSQLGAGCVDD